MSSFSIESLPTRGLYFDSWNCSEFENAFLKEKVWKTKFPFKEIVKGNCVESLENEILSQRNRGGIQPTAQKLNAFSWLLF